jgi:hypothetical protein
MKAYREHGGKASAPDIGDGNIQNTAALHPRKKSFCALKEY